MSIFGAPSSAQGMGGTHHPAAGPLTPEQVEWARCRPPSERTPLDRLPVVGDRVGLRMHEGGPVYGAVVMRVQSFTEPFPGYRDGVWPPGPGDIPDPNVWRVALDPDSRRPIPRPNRMPGYLYELVDDPWPSLTLRVDPPVTPQGRIRVKRPRVFTDAREERLPGLCGWLPAVRIDDPAELVEPPPPPVIVPDPPIRKA